jgi:purine-cytosine permease-like protein
VSSKQINESLQPVPLSERRSALTMGLVWVTMVASFPAVLAGFEWYGQGVSFAQMIVCAFISLVLLLAYSIPASELGARTGLGYCALSRIVFGRVGSIIVTANLMWMFTAWYAITAVLMARAFADLFHLPIALIYLSVIFSLLMAVNNFFGFTGVANFARFMAAPALITWVGYTFFKAVSAGTKAAVLNPSHLANMDALSITSSFIIGFAVWGNEPDYWRYSKPGVWRSGVPLLISIAIGQVIFPMAGWLVARSSGITGAAEGAAFMSNYCFGGMALLGLIILIADYFSTNDSNLFGCAAALESIWPMKHMLAVGIFALAGAVVAALLTITDASQALSVLVSLNCVVLPTPTVIMLCEWFLQKWLFKQGSVFSFVPEFSQLPVIRWPAIIALTGGLFVGIITSGLFPAFEHFHFGICSLQAWLTSVIVYVPLRIYVHKYAAA